MPRVLVIDDDRITLRVIEASLKRLNYEVITANSGEAGLKLVKSEMPDVVVTDKMMPGIDGFEVTRRLRRDPSLAHIPILVLTGEQELEDKLAAFEAGADDYLSKPFESAELAARLTALLRRTEAIKKASGFVETQSQSAHLVAVHTLRGGIGSTSLATNLAYAFSTIWQVPTLLMDMAMISGQVSLMLNRPLKRTWADLKSFQLEDIDASSMRGIVTQHTDFLHYIASPANPMEAEQVSNDLVLAGMKVLRPRYGYMVADLAHDFSDISLDVLDSADVIVLLMAPEMASIRSAALALDTYSKLGYPEDKIKVVVNWTFAKGGVAQKKIEAALHHPVSLVLPFAPTHFVNAINQGVPLLESHPDDEVSGLIEDFAFRISKESHQEIPPASPSVAWHRVANRMKGKEKSGGLRVRSLLSIL